LRRPPWCLHPSPYPRETIPVWCRCRPAEPRAAARGCDGVPSVRLVEGVCSVPDEAQQDAPMGSSDQTPSPADGLGGPDGPRLKRLPFLGDGMEGRQHRQLVTSSWRVANETCDAPDPPPEGGPPPRGGIHENKHPWAAWASASRGAKRCVGMALGEPLTAS
jgi:hypothetical protein